MIVRADFGRGLANQTYTFWKHLEPQVTVVVDMSLTNPNGYRWTQDLDAYPGAIVTQWKGYTAPFENPEAIKALRECDLIYTAETHYDERLQDHPSILHVNPEFYRGQKASQYWYPSTWRTQDLPPGPLVPTPIDDEDIAFDIAGPGKFLHVGGHSAAGDRNGSRIVHGILRQVPHPWRVTTQDGMRIRPEVLAFTEVVGNVEDRWKLYEDCAVLVYPRRYGGQSLQVNEAMARGLAVVMGTNSPNLDWPIIGVPTRPGSRMNTPGGRLETHHVIPPQLVETVNTLANDQELVESYQLRALAWARDNAWSQWLPRIRELVDAG